MNQIEAMKKTLHLAVERGFDLVSYDQPHVDYEHLSSMLDRMITDTGMSESKLGRWLGYAQGVLVAHEILSLDDCKKINEEFADDYTHRHLKRGTKYKIVGQARAQCSTLPINDGDMLTLYIGEDGVYSVRPPAEFADGRFERIVNEAVAVDMYDKME